MLRIRGIPIRRERGWFRLHDVFLASHRLDYKSPSRWLLSRSFHNLNKPKKVKVDTDFDIIWVRLELIPAYAKWISIHFQREVNEVINDYKLAQAAVEDAGHRACQAEENPDQGLEPGTTLWAGQNHTFREEGYFAKRGLQQDRPAVL